MDLNASASYEFLDLSDIDENERKKLICTLYNNNNNNNKTSSSTQEDTIKLNKNNKNNNFKKKDTTITTTTTLKKIHQHHTSYTPSSTLNSSVNGSSSTSFSNNSNTINNNNNNNIKEFSNRNSRFINESNNKHVSKNIATIKYPQHLSSSSHVKTHAEQGKLFCKPYSGNTLNSTTMTQHNQTQHQQQQQQQSQQQPPPPPPQQQQQLMNTQSPQIQANQSQQALSQNNNYSHPHLTQTHAFNQVPSGGLYMHPHGAQPVSGTFYHLLPAASIPSSSVYVHNVTANVNYHGYPAPSYIPAGTAATSAYIPGETQQNIAHVAEQNTTTTQTVPNPTGRNPRSRRGRGNAGNNRRNDYSQRQQQQPSPSPQEVLNLQLDPQALGYVQYGYSYPFYGTPQNIAHAQAQQAAGSPLYPISMFTAAGSPMCSYPGMIYQPAMIPQEYLVDEKGEEHSAEGVLAQPMWPVFYPEDYVGHELVEDVNHNPSPITSSDTPSMLSPSYPIYETPMQPMDLQQQMNTMHICESHPISQSVVVEESIQNSTILASQQQPCEQIVLDNHPSLVPIENNIIVDHLQQQQQQQQSVLMDDTKTNEKIETISVNDNASMAHVSNVPQQYAEQNMTALPIVIENQNIQQLCNNVAVIQQHITDDSLPTVATDKKDSSIENHLNQNQSVLTSSSDEQQQQQQQQQQISENKLMNAGTNENKQINNEISVVPTSNENSQIRNISMKTITWTNQNKKSTASVAVTATPTSANNNNNKSSNLTNNKGSNNNTITNLNLTAHQTVQVKNYGAMKTPSSPAATNENNINSGINNGSINNNEKRIIQSQPTQNEATRKGISTTSTGSTVIPQHLQENRPINSVSVRNEIKKDSQMSDSAAKTESTELTIKEENNTTNSVQALPSQGPLSWASLFVNKSNTFSNTSSPPSQQLQPNNPTQSKKPVAKVFPFEGTSNFTPPVTPGNMSYSAASAQGLANSQTNVNHTNAVKSKPLPTSSNASGINNRETDEWSLKFADFLTKHKIDYSPISLRPRGLTNRSNYCYINAILQALVGCSPFYNLMKSIPKQTAALMSEKTNTPTIHAMMQLVAEFSHLPPGTRLNRREKGQQKKDDLCSELSCDPSFEPTAIYKLWNASRSDNEGRQEDAEEFLGYVLNKLNDEMLEVIKLISKPNAEQNGDANYDADDGGEDWQMIYNNRNKGSITRQTDFGRTPVSDIFRGELRSRLQREGEHSVTDVIQPFFTLQLNIEKAASVKEALEILVGRDQLEGVTCSKTNQEVAAWQQMTLEKLPVVLILHLKWFDYKMDGCTKIFKTVEFPVELRIDTKILASKKYSQKQKLYRLFAVVYHDGKEASKGHYITDVYHTGYSSWLRYDDSSVKPVSENNVLRPRTPRVPYLLYYRRCDTVPVQNAANK